MSMTVARICAVSGKATPLLTVCIQREAGSAGAENGGGNCMVENAEGPIMESHSHVNVSYYWTELCTFSLYTNLYNKHNSRRNLRLDCYTVNNCYN